MNLEWINMFAVAQAALVLQTAIAAGVLAAWAYRMPRLILLMSILCIAGAVILGVTAMYQFTARNIEGAYGFVLVGASFCGGWVSLTLAIVDAHKEVSSRISYLDRHRKSG